MSPATALMSFDSENREKAFDAVKRIRKDFAKSKGRKINKNDID